MRAKAILASGDTNVIRLVDRGKASVTSAHAAVQAKRGRPTGDADCHAMRRLLTGLDALLRKDKPRPDDLRSLAARLSVALAAIAEGQDERASA